ncbi:unnamed protein product, partial [Scytosiphon promiscuus]
GEPAALAGPGGSDGRRERARMLARDDSTFTSSSSVGTTSTSTVVDEGSGRDIGGDGGGGGKGEGRRKEERRRAKGERRAGRIAETVEKKKEEEEEPEEMLTRTTLCPVLEPEVQDVVFKIFDIDKSGTVTREEMVLGVVNTFKDHRSLAHTLQDSEHIARKLGLIIMAVILFILV